MQRSPNMMPTETVPGHEQLTARVAEDVSPPKKEGNSKSLTCIFNLFC